MQILWGKCWGELKVRLALSLSQELMWTSTFLSAIKGMEWFMNVCTELFMGNISVWSFYCNIVVSAMIWTGLWSSVKAVFLSPVGATASATSLSSQLTRQSNLLLYHTVIWMYKLCKPSLYFRHHHFGKAWKSSMLPCRITARNCTGFSDNRVNLFGTVHSALCVYYNIVSFSYAVKRTVYFLPRLSSGFYSVLSLVGACCLRTVSLGSYCCCKST